MYYALKAIKSKMVDFWRSTIEKAQLKVQDHDQDGNPTVTAVPFFVQIETTVDPDGESESVIDNFPHRVNYVSSITASIDVCYVLEKAIQNPKLFSEDDRKVYQIYYKEGYNVSETAEYLDVSVSYASKMITKTTQKIKYILSE
ncbi:hypothetical protein ACQ86N_02765 [Puia sp. P3]|uniref:hypothetical protein n=1 Tax=Puia sp. P3 TaxID=3423952 RepID=UPI003D67FD61